VEADVLSSTDDGTSRREKAERGPAAWEHFAPLHARRPVWRERLSVRTARLRRLLGHEWTIAVLGGLGLSLLLNAALPVALNGWELPDPTRTLPQDPWDPSLVTYLIAWVGHALVNDPASLWHTNGFFPAPYALAYSDSLLGYAPLAIIGSGPEAAILRYNIIFVLAQALAFVGAYALARQLGLGRTAAAVVGVAFAVAPWRLAQAGHLQVISTGGMALALAMLARGHGVRWRRGEDRPPTRPGWTLAGWMLAAWQLTLGFGIGLVFAYILLASCVAGALWWLVRQRTRPRPALLLAGGAGGLVFAGVALLMAQPYLKVLERYPYTRRDAAWIELYSPPPRGLLTAPGESLIWGGVHAGVRGEFGVPGEMALLPGFALIALAAAGLIVSVWRVWVRVGLAAGVVATAVFALGTNGPAGGRAGYLALMDLPGFDGLRTPGRLIIWTTLLLGLLAGGAVGAVVDRSHDAALQRGLPRPATMARLALLVPMLLVLAEGLGDTPRAAVPPAPPTLSTVAPPYLVLPTHPVGDMHVLFWSTDRFAATANGGSGVVPTEQQRTREMVMTFPDAASVDYLRGLGVRTVVVLPDLADGTPWQAAAEMPIDGLGISREVTADAVVFSLSP
jgi:hypothetical protein